MINFNITGQHQDIFFTADTHFSHANIIKHCNRPWVNIDEHNEKLIEKWNNIVSKKSMVYLLGDFAMIPKDPNIPRMKLYRKLRFRLNGKIILIKGNHDHMSQEMYDCFTKVYDFGTDIKIDKIPITLCHYPMRSWNKSCHGAGHLFGHVHGRLEKVNTGMSFDVGVDVSEWNYSPVPWELVQNKMKEKYENIKEKS